MKFVKIGLLSVMASVSVAATASQTKFVAGDDSIETQICISAAQNELRQYRKNVAKISTKTPMQSRNHVIVANTLQCNDQKVVNFARSYGANRTADYIARHLKPSVSVIRDVAVVEKQDAKVIVVTANK